jgi:ribosomal protein S9
VKELRRNEWVTIATAATRLAVAETLIRKWAQRYKVAINPRGEYLFHDLSEAEHKTRHSPGARRKLTTGR